ncbi:MAG: ATP phosphoribosyltransferase regulatory subunit [Gammaproteobacteria bacterium]|nr:ATP phosphoribosyltransferase regulatory subunit [Gammaproteobacteria bacterium]
MSDEHWLLPEGIDEVLPPQALALEGLRRSLLDLYDTWGYELVIPPFIEYLESLLTGTGGDLNLQTFKLTDQITGRTLGIRADITPQAARIDAHQLRRDYPTRLCYLGSTLNSRLEGLAGSRSPLQTGAELYGHAGVEADLEIIDLMLASLQKVGVRGVHLDLGHVGIFRALARQAGLNQRQELALFDALQRKAIPELEALVDSYGLEEIPGLMLISLADLSGVDALVRAETSLAPAGEEVRDALAELSRVSNQFKQSHPDTPVHFDLAELRGYHYHTGLVFAAFVPQLGQEVARGGRYDDIGKLFGRARPACGFSADLKVLFRLGTSGEDPRESAVFSPWVDDPRLEQRISELRAAGRRVIRGLPGQKGDAREMGCGEVLTLRDDTWIVISVS